MKPQPTIVTIALIATLMSLGCQSPKSATVPKAPADSRAATTAARQSGTTSAVDIVKTGMLPGYSSITIGEALGGKFKTGKWTSFETPKGQLIVEFGGNATYKEMHDAGFQPSSTIRNPPDEQLRNKVAVPVSFQFVFSDDRKGFSLAAIDDVAFGTAPTHLILAFVYG